MSRKSTENSPGSPSPWWEPVILLFFGLVCLALFVVVVQIVIAA